MTKYRQTPIALLVCAAMLFAPALAPAQQPKPASAAGLRIVVIAGEDAVNIIQQKTAVNPIVEVRDRNNLPVSGVAVTFSVGGQGATFGGASALTVTTNAAGQAVVTGLTPTATGAITINATATVQGQAIAATITQTNFATAAEAAQAAASTGGAGSGGASGSGGGGTSGAAGGGGISGATLGIVGGAIAGVGAIAAAASGGGGDSAPATTSTPPPAAPTATTFNGPVSGTTTFTWTTSEGGQVFLTCTATYARNGTLRMILTTQSNGTVTGTAQMLSFTTRVTSTVCSGGLQVPIPNVIHRQCQRQHRSGHRHDWEPPVFRGLFAERLAARLHDRRQRHVDVHRQSQWRRHHRDPCRDVYDDQRWTGTVDSG